jgi:hypothetical protein
MGQYVLDDGELICTADHLVDDRREPGLRTVGGQLNGVASTQQELAIRLSRSGARPFTTGDDHAVQLVRLDVSGVTQPCRQDDGDGGLSDAWCSGDQK